jgi:AbrB family looped-hinge helix DNA binding protein
MNYTRKHLSGLEIISYGYGIRTWIPRNSAKKLQYPLFYWRPLVESLERQIRVSTQGRVTIPKAIRDSLRIEDGQPLVLRTDSRKREILVIVESTIPEYGRSD